MLGLMVGTFSLLMNQSSLQIYVLTFQFVTKWSIPHAFHANFFSSTFSSLDLSRSKEVSVGGSSY